MQVKSHNNNFCSIEDISIKVCHVRECQLHFKIGHSIIMPVILERGIGENGAGIVFSICTKGRYSFRIKIDQGFGRIRKNGG